MDGDDGIVATEPSPTALTSRSTTEGLDEV
jgi:hypothetical protein